MPDEMQQQTTASSSVGEGSPASSTSAPAETSSNSAPVATKEDAAVGWLDSLDKALSEAEATSTKEKEVASDEKETTKEDKRPVVDTEADDELLTKNMTPKAGSVFRAIKAEKKEALAKVAELEAKLKALESNKSTSDPAAEEALKQAIAEREQKIQEYEAELAVSRVEATQEWKDSVVQPIAAILGVVERLAKKYDMPEKKLVGILEESDLDLQGDLISEAAASFSERDRVSLYALADDFAAVLAHRDELRKNAATALSQREKAMLAKKAAQEVEEKKQWSAATNKVWDTIKAKIPLPEDASLEATVKQKISTLDFSKLSPEERAFAAFSGEIVPVVVKQAKALQAEVAELKAALAKYRGATPGAGSGHSAPARSGFEGLSFLEAVERQLS